MAAKAVGTNDVFTFQLKLYELNHSIEFIYGAWTDGTSDASACMGIRDDMGGVDHTIDAKDGNRSTVTHWAASKPFEQADRTSGEFPVNGTVIQLIPPY
jgi:hypothetical protein